VYSDVESEVHDVALSNDVLLPLGPELPSVPGLLLPAASNEIGVGNGLRPGRQVQKAAPSAAKSYSQPQAAINAGQYGHSFQVQVN